VACKLAAHNKLEVIARARQLDLVEIKPTHKISVA
jgi:hypothetical protein